MLIYICHCRRWQKETTENNTGLHGTVNPSLFGAEVKVHLIRMAFSMSH